ncbi:MAG: hypothetical protein A2Y17_04650 [Clostridiales bacterium GWF2_38_85]|nr:MAG: hypothetical protein A2Y17_04650 [Clostridiales bacterium GWF2_38_85]
MIKLNTIDNGQVFDFGKASKDYSKFRDIYPKELYDTLYLLGVGHEDQDWLDMGTGTGQLPRGLYHYGAKITGIDISQNQINEAVRMADEKKMNITFKACSAENTEFADSSFDVITACQCFWYFDKEKIVPEIKRLLKSKGLFVKIYMTWIKEDPIASESHALVKSLNQNWTSGSSAVQDLRIHCFDNPVMESFYADLPFTPESWHGRIRACRGVLGSMDNETLQKFETEHQKLSETFPETFTVKHKIYITSYQIRK